MLYAPRWLDYGQSPTILVWWAPVLPGPGAFFLSDPRGGSTPASAAKRQWNQWLSFSYGRRALSVLDPVRPRAGTLDGPHRCRQDRLSARVHAPAPRSP